MGVSSVSAVSMPTPGTRKTNVLVKMYLYTEREPWSKRLHMCCQADDVGVLCVQNTSGRTWPGGKSFSQEIPMYPLE